MVVSLWLILVRYDPTVDDSDFYDGEWKECVPHGFGTRQYINGDRYVGNYENGIRSGHGTMIWLEERQVHSAKYANITELLRIRIKIGITIDSGVQRRLGQRFAAREW